MRIVLAILCVAAAATAAAATAPERKVTLAVKNADVVDVLRSLQTQCGVKNLVIDPGVGGPTGSLFLKDVPCSTAFKVVLKMSGLDAKIYEGSLVHVGAARR